MGGLSGAVGGGGRLPGGCGVIWSLIGLALLALVVIGVARRDAIGAALDRFDASNLAKRRRALAALRTPNAHMMLTVEEIDGRTPGIERVWAQDPETGAMVKRFLWQGETFTDEDAAEAARAHAILHEARAFYAEIDARNRLSRPGR